MAQTEKKANVSDEFKGTILAYLQKQAETDTVLKQKLDNPQKSIDECCDYIISEVRKSGRCGFADNEIYGMALHYYDEDKIDIGESSSGCKVVVNHTIELSDEEKEEARRVAFNRAVEEQKRKITATTERKSEKKTETKNEKQLELF